VEDDWMPMAKKVSDTTAFKVAAFESNECISTRAGRPFT
jgi:hypothetical protein